MSSGVSSLSGSIFKVIFDSSLWYACKIRMKARYPNVIIVIQ